MTERETLDRIAQACGLPKGEPLSSILGNALFYIYKGKEKVAKPDNTRSILDITQNLKPEYVVLAMVIAQLFAGITKDAINKIIQLVEENNNGEEVLPD